MSENKKAQKSPEELQAEMQERVEAIQKEYDEIFEQLEEGGYFKQTYAEDSSIQIPGTLFNSFIYFVSQNMQTLHTMQSSINILLNTTDAMINNMSATTIALMKQHKTNVDLGATISNEEWEKRLSEKNMVEVEDPSTGKKKNRKKKVIAKEGENEGEG